MIPATVPAVTAARLDALRAELADLAFSLEVQGRCDAADVANLVRERLGALVAEAEGQSAPDSVPALPDLS